MELYDYEVLHRVNVLVACVRPVQVVSWSSGLRERCWLRVHTERTAGDIKCYWETSMADCRDGEEYEGGKRMRRGCNVVDDRLDRNQICQ